MKKKELSKNSLLKFYYSCPLFKKYYDLGLWFGDFNEYQNIKYCEKYLQKYIYISLQNIFLKNNRYTLYLTLIKSTRFIKFIESGVFCYINSHFLLSFYENSFIGSFPKSRLKIEIFIENYFKLYLQEKLVKDFLVCQLKSVNDVTFYSFQMYEDSICHYTLINLSNYSRLSDNIFFSKNTLNRQKVKFLNKPEELCNKKKRYSIFI
uniref:Uncharacterized protein n=1 Tax=Colpomenia peregrina TaxID=27965 RepID=A0A0U1XDU8_9PHAE|nr:hypothetical protein CopeMp22 [Colpomenia peregrina]AIR12200.1 hypothetical protein CopeMp22 [Colpomenia peregrina]